MNWLKSILDIIGKIFGGDPITRGMRTALSRLGINKLHHDIKHEYKTPRGVRVLSVAPVASLALVDIDTGIQEQLVRHNAKFPNWDKFKNHPDYTVIFIKPMGYSVETEPGAPVILIQGQMSAGTAIGNKSSAAVLHYIVAPSQHESDWKYRQYLVNTIWNESEHVRESQNSFEEFIKYVGFDDVHPHVP